VTYKDKVVATYFSACNGDATANSEDVWGSKLGYLRSRKDSVCGKGHTDHAWKVKQTGLELARTLKAKGLAGTPKAAGSTVFVQDLSLVRGTGGWVKQATVKWSNGASSSLALADNVRIKFGLRSANFSVTNSLESGAASSAAKKPVVKTYQENSSLIKRVRGKWKRASHKKFSGKKAFKSTKYKSKITMRLKASSLVWYGQVGPAGGRAKVYVDGKLKKTVQLKAAKITRVKKLYTAKGLSLKKTHRFTIVVIKKKKFSKTGAVFVDKIVVTGGKLVK
jgi:hypothetical protein